MQPILLEQAGDFLQVGNDEIFDEFQSGWSGAPYTPEVPFNDDSKAKAVIIGLTGKPEAVKKKKKKKGGQCEEIHPVRCHGTVCGKSGRGKSHQTSPSDLACRLFRDFFYLDDLELTWMKSR